MKAHAKLSPSGSARWLNCAGSVKAEADYLAANPDTPTTSVFAEEGTRAHTVAETALRDNNGDALVLAGGKFDGEVVDAEMCRHVQDYIDYVLSHADDKSALLIEERVSLEPIVPKCFGTCDAVVMNSNAIHIIDLKYGRGVKVNAGDNSQLMLYALGFILESGPIYEWKNNRKVVLHIAQPRLAHYDTHKTTVGKLLKWGDSIKPKAKAALGKNPPRVAGETQCRWCVAKPDCEALNKHVTAIVGDDFDNLDASAIDDNRRKAVLDNADLIVGYINAIKDDVFRRVYSGEKFDGYKIVAGRSIRKWKPDAENQLIGLLGDKAYNRKLIGVTDATKALGKSAIADLLEKPQGKPTLVAATDKRPDYVADATDEFDKVGG